MGRRPVRAILVAAVAAFVGALIPATAGAEPSWLPVSPISAPGANAARGEIGVDRDGNTTVVFERGGTLQALFRPAGGSFGTPQPVADGNLPTAASLAIDRDGNALLVYTQTDGSIRPTFFSFRPAGGSFSEGVQISPDGVFTDNPKVVVDRFGNALVGWQQDSPGLGVAFRPAGGSFGVLPSLGSGAQGGNGFDIAFDDQGNAIVMTARLETAPAESFIEAATRPAGGSFGPLEPVASAVGGTANPVLAVDGSGNTIAVFDLWDSTVTDPQTNRYRVYTSFHPAGGSFSAAEPVATNNRFSIGDDVAFYADGTAIAVWTQGFQPRAAIRPPGGSFGDPKLLSPPVHDVLIMPSVSIDAHQIAHIVWPGTSDANGYATRTVMRPAGGSFTEMQTLSGYNVHSNEQPELASDPFGNTAAIWRRNDGTNYIYELAVFDGGAPVLQNLQIPANGTVGTDLPFSVTPVDAWSPVATTTWSFGDGATAEGGSVSHAFAAPGSFSPSVTATDALGNSATSGGTVELTPPQPVPTPVLPAATLALTKASLSPKSFRAAPRGASLAAAVGTRVRFTLERAAKVTFRAERAAKGRRVGRRCRKVTAKNRGARPCTRYVRVKGSASRAANAGQNSVRFSGRLAGRKLKPGRYRLIVSAVDPGGIRSKTVRLPFRIVAR